MAILCVVRYRDFMKHARVLLVLCLGVTLNFGALVPAHSSTWQEQMLQSLNSIRAQKSLKPLEICKPLTQAAQRYARTMAQQDFLSHIGKDGSNVGERIQAAGYDWRNSKTGSSIGENIAAGQQSVAEVMKGWRNSTSHYKNMTNTKFTHVGFGMSVNPKSKFKKYWVQNFGFGASCPP
jgi:uncharacterized protein YkwD